MATEDFTTYTEVDSHGNITVTSSKIDVVQMPRRADSHVTKDKGASHFGDFEHLLEIYYNSSSQSTGIGGVWGIADHEYNYYEMDTNNEGMICYIYAGQIRIVDFTNNNLDWGNITQDVLRYLTIERSGTTLTCKIYSDASRTTLVDTLTITCTNAQYRYIFGCLSRYHLSDPYITYYVQNLDLQEAPPAVGGILTTRKWWGDL